MMIYEAKQVRLDTWLFEKSPVNSRPLTSKLRQVKEKFDEEKQETVKKATRQQTEIEEMKLQSLRNNHRSLISCLTKDWEIKLQVICD
jgi:hypothetical protein